MRPIGNGRPTFDGSKPSKKSAVRKKFVINIAKNLSKKTKQTCCPDRKKLKIKKTLHKNYRKTNKAVKKEVISNVHSNLVENDELTTR